MLVPAAMEDLHEAHAALGQPAGQQAAGREGAGLVHVRAVHVEDRFRLLRDVDQVRHAGLHAEGHLVLGDAGLRFGIAELVEAASD